MGVPGQGPYSKKPRKSPPGIPGPHGPSIDGAYWGQVRNGDWYAFYSNVGPTQEDYCYEHPDDPNWWHDQPDQDPEDFHGWACRHGYYASHCPDDLSCGPRPQIVTVTDEEVEEAGKKLAELLSSMESK